MMLDSISSAWVLFSPFSHPSSRHHCRGPLWNLSRHWPHNCLIANRQRKDWWRGHSYCQGTALTHQCFFLLFSLCLCVYFLLKAWGHRRLISPQKNKKVPTHSCTHMKAQLRLFGLSTFIRTNRKTICQPLSRTQSLVGHSQDTPKCSNKMGLSTQVFFVCQFDNLFVVFHQVSCSAF